MVQKLCVVVILRRSLSKGGGQMKKKPFRILEERLKYNYIVIELFKRRNFFSFGVSTSIIGHPEHGAYNSFFEGKNAALHYVINCHASPLQQAILKKFRLMKDIDQPYLFDDM
jgi:hypothetical protein